MRRVNCVDTSSDNHLDVHIVVNAILATLTADTGVLDTAESTTCQYHYAPSVSQGVCTHGAAESEITPVLIATIPNSSLSDTRCALRRSLVIR